LTKEASMNPIHGHIDGAALAQRYRQEAETAHLLAPAPSRRASRPTIARALRSLAQRLSAYADRIEPTTARFAHPGRAATHHRLP
jgi:hypothetical protein